MLLLSSGQHEARTRWNTHESGAAFDRKKVSYLSEQAQTFIAQQTMCVLAGTDPVQEICGLLVMGYPGFVRIIDQHTCLIPFSGPLNARLIRGLCQDRARGKSSQVAICFINHASRERLCIQGECELLSTPPESSMTGWHVECLWMKMHISQSFFHCPKYIRTRIDGLTISPGSGSSLLAGMLGQERYTEPIWTFVERSVLCFLCTINQAGHCAINHRGGKVGFLVTSPSQREIILPDYEGNGAFEAVGNILETGQTALVIPDYSAQVALSISGRAHIVEMPELSAALQQRLRGARRVIRLKVARIEGYRGDWTIPLAYERERSQLYWANKIAPQTCSL